MTSPPPPPPPPPPLPPWTRKPRSARSPRPLSPPPLPPPQSWPRKPRSGRPPPPPPPPLPPWITKPRSALSHVPRPPSPPPLPPPPSWPRKPRTVRPRPPPPLPPPSQTTNVDIESPDGGERLFDAVEGMMLLSKSLRTCYVCKEVGSVVACIICEKCFHKEHCGPTYQIYGLDNYNFCRACAPPNLDTKVPGDSCHQCGVLFDLVSASEAEEFEQESKEESEEFGDSCHQCGVLLDVGIFFTVIAWLLTVKAIFYFASVVPVKSVRNSMMMALITS